MAKKKAAGEDLAFAAERTFLAQEFLTWLWFRCEVEGGEFDLEETGELSIVVEDALSLSSWEEEGKKSTLRGGTPTTRPEAATALGAGLLLKRAKLLIAIGGREWQCSLDGDSLDLLSVKVPERPEGEEPEEGADLLAEKLALGEELRDAVDELYRHFLSLRLGNDWKKIEVRRMNDWVKQKLEECFAELATAE